MDSEGLAVRWRNGKALHGLESVRAFGVETGWMLQDCSGIVLVTLLESAVILVPIAKEEQRLLAGPGRRCGPEQSG
jgi:hypothetical protein